LNGVLRFSEPFPADGIAITINFTDAQGVAGVRRHRATLQQNRDQSRKINFEDIE
jgi:hypothetical protein